MTTINKSDNAEIAVLQTQMSGVQDTVGRIETKIDNLGAAYVTVSEFQQLKLELLAFKKQYWLSHTLTALLTAFVVSLIYYFITNHAHVAG